MATQVPQQGWSQQTAAVTTILRNVFSGSTKRASSRRAKTSAKRRRPSKARSASTRKRSARSAKPKRLVKGSAAAKRYMAKIRKLRK